MFIVFYTLIELSPSNYIWGHQGSEGYQTPNAHNMFNLWCLPRKMSPWYNESSDKLGEFCEFLANDAQNL